MVLQARNSRGPESGSGQEHPSEVPRLDAGNRATARTAKPQVWHKSDNVNSSANLCS